jgi:lysophospholipase L1-like esterase
MPKMNSYLQCVTFPLLFLLTFSTLRAEILVKSGDKIAFLGDSITANGWKDPGGYVRLVISGLEANGIKAEAIPAGVSGNKSNQMLERLDASVLSKNPQWMTLSCGVNDVWHSLKGNGIPLNDKEAAKKDPKVSGQPGVGTYEKNITAIIDKAQAANVKPVILTATIIQEDLHNPLNKKLEDYNQFLITLAKERNLPLADLNDLCQKRIKADKKGDANLLTVDGVHMNAEGNKVMARGVLQAFGLNEEELKKAEDFWANPTAVVPAVPAAATAPAETPSPAAATESVPTPSPEPAM